jgi:hypothetical protein
MNRFRSDRDRGGRPLLASVGNDMGLPVFRYHRDPIASGSIEASGAQCLCCNKRRGFISTDAEQAAKALPSMAHQNMRILRLNL